MSDILFIRHAETDMAGGFCGHSNPDVNARGHEQIISLLKTLASQQIDAVYTSDLQRAITTADALAHAFEIPSVAATPALREIAFGEWEGLSWNEIEQRYPIYARRWIEAYPTLPAPDGEAFEDFQVRVIDEIKRLTKLRDRRLAVVTHAGVMRVVLRTLFGLDEQAAWEQTKSHCCFFHYSPEYNRPPLTKTLRVTSEEFLAPAVCPGEQL